MKTTDSPIIVKHSIDSSPSTIWKAITELDQMKQWFFDNIPDFVATVGFETEFAVHSADRTFTHMWKIVEVVPFEKISYSWKYKEYRGDSLLSFILIEDEGVTELCITMEVLEDFPSDVPEFAVESCVGGWNYFIGERLKGFLLSRKIT